MQRTFTVSVPTGCTDPLIAELQPLDVVIGLSVQRGGSLKPPGDVLTLQVLNKGADDVLKRLASHCEGENFSIATAELASLIDPDHFDIIRKDVDEAIWEEMETGLRYQGHPTGNFLALMALGGAIAAVGLVSEPGPQAVAFVAASIIAPGFEPLAAIPLGVVLGKPQTAWLGLRASLIGYGLVILSAALTFWLLRWAGTTSATAFTGNAELKMITDPTPREITVSVCGTLAGTIIVAAYRRSVIAGALIAIIVITVAAMIGISLVCGRFDLALEGLERFSIDVALIIAAGSLVFGAKQLLIRRRRPIV